MRLDRRTLLAGVGASALPLLWPPVVAGASERRKRGLAEAVNLLDFAEIARDHIAAPAYAYVAGGAADEITLRDNRAAYDRIRLRPRVLVDVSKLDTGLALFGQALAHPILLAPTALHREIHPEGELATVRGAAAAGAAMVISTYANTAVEDIAGAAAQPVWFQLYLRKDRGFTRDLVQRAENAGCKAICLTVDTPVSGARNRQHRAGFTPRFGTPNTAGYAATPEERDWRKDSIYSPRLLSSMTWKDVEWLQSVARVPVLLKGILDAGDAETAVTAGAGGIIVSNHGGRNLDTLPASIDALPAVTDRVAGRIPVLVDGGVRRGTDVLKALAHGAQAVLIGRPYLYGLGIGGAAGVQRAVDILHREFRFAMALSGCPSIGSINRSILW